MGEEQIRKMLEYEEKIREKKVTVKKSNTGGPLRNCPKSWGEK